MWIFLSDSGGVREPQHRWFFFSKNVVLIRLPRQHWWVILGGISLRWGWVTAQQNELP